MREAFIETLQASADIPESIRANAAAVGEVRSAPMTQSYLDFLDRESHHNPRGPRWEAVMQKRRAHMLPFRDAVIADGIIRLDGCSFYVMIAPDSRSVVHWEEL